MNQYEDTEKKMRILDNLCQHIKDIFIFVREKTYESVHFTAKIVQVSRLQSERSLDDEQWIWDYTEMEEVNTYDSGS